MLDDAHLQLALYAAPNIITSIGMPMVLQRPRLHPLVADLAIDGVTHPGRGLHLGVELAVVDVSRIRRNPPEAGADFLVGGA